MTTTTGHTKGFVRYLRTNSAVSALEYAILTEYCCGHIGSTRGIAT